MSFVAITYEASHTSDEKQNHLFGKNAKLRLMDMDTKKIKDITRDFFGPLCSFVEPDSHKIAFVSYSVK